MTDHINVRALALETLLAVMEDGGQSHFVMREMLNSHPSLTAQERSFYRRLTAGTIEYALQLDYILNIFSRTKTNRMKPVIREILRMAVYQIRYMDAVPDAAAVNEAVKLTRRRGYAGLSGYVNGVLRAAARGMNRVHFPSMDDDPLRCLEIRYSVPADLLRSWADEFGLEAAEQICRGFTVSRPVTVRVRGPRKAELCGKYDRMAEQDESGADGERASHQKRVRKAPYAEDAYYIEDAGSLRDLPAFRDGSLIVQDVSSQIAVRAAGIRPGDTVLDLCAAPGGKSILAADLTGPDGFVEARDVSEKRAARIVENAERCNVKNINIVVKDAREMDDFKADVVICDVPCTGYGDIGHKPEIRYRADDEKREQLIRLQREILAAAVGHLKPAGTLLFSTCTFGHRENQDTVQWLEKNYPLHPVDLTGRIPADVAALPGVAESAVRGYVQLLPGFALCDGFFFSVFTLN